MRNFVFFAASFLTAAPALDRQKAIENFGRIPAHFEPNQGQAAAWVDFVSRGRGYELEVSASQARLRTRSGSVTMRLVGVAPGAKASALDPLEGKVSYFTGSDRSKWRTGIPAYGRVRVEQVYPGIDLIYYGNQQELEYDLVVASGADPGRVEMEFDGAREVRVAEDGALVLEVEGGPVRWRKPVLYQGSGEGRREVAGGYEVGKDGRVRFRVGEYDRSRELVIDPVLEYVNFLHESEGYGLAVDAAGSVYLPGNDGNRPFILKLNPAGTAFTYLAYVGGHGRALAIAVDPTGNAFVGGSATSEDIPAISAGQVTGTLPLGGFVFGVNASGTQPIFSVSMADPANTGRWELVYDPVGNQILTFEQRRYFTAIRIPDGARTRLRYGNTSYYASGLAVDAASGDVFLSGTVTAFDPYGSTPLHPVNGPNDCFVSRLTREGRSFRSVATVHLGGSDQDGCSDIALDDDFIYAGGFTLSPGFPPAVSYRVGAGSGFIVRLNRDLTENPTYLASGNISAWALDGGKLYFGATVRSTGLAVGASIKPDKEGPGGPIGVSRDGGLTWSAASDVLGDFGYSISVDPRNSSRVYASGDSGTYRSLDRGNSWRFFLNRGLSIAVSSDGSRIYQVSSFFRQHLGVFSDTGTTLVGPMSVFSGISPFDIRPYADPVGPLVAYVVAETGVVRTADGGVTWAKILNASTSGLAIHPTVPSTLWAATSTGLMKSVDTGATWTVSGTGLPSGKVEEVAVARSNPNVLYCVAAHRVHRSINGGLSWGLAGGGLPIIDSRRSMEETRRLAVSPSNPDIAYLATPYGAFHTVNGGGSWTGLPRFGGRHVASIAVDPANPAVLFAATYDHSDLLVGKLTLDGQPEWITYFGGRSLDSLSSLRAQSGSVYVSGSTWEGRDLPATAPVPLGWPGNFVAKIGSATPASCTYQVKHTSLGTTRGAITVISPPGCAWAASTTDPWVYLPPGSSGTGTGTVQYWLEVNSVASRTGSIAIAGTAVSISQGSGECTYDFNPRFRTLGNAAGTETVSLITQTGCPWNIGLFPSGEPRAWAASPASGTGPATISYSFPASSSAQWETFPTTLAILNDGRSIVGHTISRPNLACTATASPNSLNFAAAGATSSIDLAIPLDCIRTPSTTATWLTVTPAASTGPGKLTIKSAPNLASAARSATITVAGTPIAVTQAGNCGPGLCSFAGPIISNPTPGLTIGVSGVTFQWGAINGVAGYQMRITQGGSLVFEGALLGANATTTLVSLPHAAGYTFGVRGCMTQPFADSNCGAFSTVDFNVSLQTAQPPTITAPTNIQSFASSTQTFRWSAVAGAQSYELELTSFERELSMTVFGSGGNPPPTEAVYSMHSGSYNLRVRSCVAACGAWSSPVSFTVTLPSIPALAPNAPTCSLNTNRLNCNWNSVANADIYVIQAVNPTAGPGGGAITVASRQVPTPSSGDLLVPTGPISVFVAACNGNGCGPYSAPAQLNVTAPNPAQPVLGSPIPGSQVTSNPVFFSWNRIPGDNGSNTVYRLFVQDLSRGATGLDILTRSNFHAAAFKGEGSRYDALVVANPDTPRQVVGPASGFIVRAANPDSPTMVQPRHQQPGIDATVPAGNVLLSWSPVPGSTLYEYFVAQPGQSNAVARGITPGLFVQVPVPAVGGAPTAYSGIVRACTGGPCAFGSDAYWGPWSNAPGGPGVTSFIVR